MKKIEKWLQENGLEYDHNEYGNPYYFDDGFSVPGITVSFYFDGIGNDLRKSAEFVRYMDRQKSYTCTRQQFGAGFTYRIMTVFDTVRLTDHEKRIANAAEAFWQERRNLVSTAC